MESSRKLSDKAVQKVVDRLTPSLMPGENVRYVGQCLNISPALSHFLITDTRFIGAEQGSVRFAHLGSDLEQLDIDPVKGRITLKARGHAPFTIKSIPQPDMDDVRVNLERLQARTSTPDQQPDTAPVLPPPTGEPTVLEAQPEPPPPGEYAFDVVLTAIGRSPIQVIKEVRSLTSLDLAAAKRATEGAPFTLIEAADPVRAQDAKQRLEGAGASVDLVASTGPASAPAAASGGVAPRVVSSDPSARHCGGSLSKAAARAVTELAHGDERPWLILNPAGATGALVAFEDRLAIIKTGALTGFMAGSTFGGRQTVMYFQDITGIEFNAGLLNGVLEILTASYQGTDNKDFWQGTLRSRNANANDPFTLSNTLPMTKSEYRDWQEHVNELRRRISVSKRPAAPQMVAAAPAQDSFADQVAKLAQLRADGLLSEEEFAAAKQKLMQS